MKITPARIVIAAACAGTLGLVASLAFDNRGPLLGTETGQRLLNGTVGTLHPAPPGVPVAVRGEPLPAIEISALDGGTFRLPSDFKGQPLLVNVWASWCGPCIEEMPELDRFAAEQGADGTRILGIALDDPDAVRAFLAQVPVRYAIAIDTPGAADSSVQLGNARGVLPYSALVSADGILLKQKIGPFEHGEIDAWAEP